VQCEIRNYKHTSHSKRVVANPLSTDDRPICNRTVTKLPKTYSSVERAETKNNDTNNNDKINEEV